MDNLETLQELFRHMEWADAKVWTAALARPEAIEDSNLKERLYHIHLVQRAFLKVWRGEPLKPHASTSFPDIASLLRWGHENYSEFNEYTSGLAAMDLERPIVMPWIEMFEARLGRKAEAPTFHETLLQVAMHSTYHRGQVNTRLRELGSEPPLTDFIAWVWSGKPQPGWPAPV
ncbi:MAG TPA: DinB family protein [Pyrinomonadaceae bacterium]|jgi:uncharacterized damage-inducible protein DinB